MHLLPRKFILSFAQLLMMIGSILFALSPSSPTRYWSHVFPGLVIGVFGCSAAYVSSNVTTMENARRGEEGVVGGALYTSYQIGSTVGVAVATAVTLGVNHARTAAADVAGTAVEAAAKGYEASFWTLVGVHGIMIIIVFLFVKQ